MKAVWFLLGCVAGLAALDFGRQQRCLICRRSWAVWPIRNHLGKREFVCRRDFHLHRKKITA